MSMDLTTVDGEAESSVIQLPAEEESDGSADDAVKGGGAGIKQWPRKRLIGGIVVASVAFLALVIGLGASLSTTRGEQTTASSSNSLSFEDCEEEWEEKGYLGLPTEYSSDYQSIYEIVEDLGPTEPSRLPADDEPEQALFFPLDLGEDGNEEDLNSHWDDVERHRSNDFDGVRRKLGGKKKKIENVALGLQRLGTTTAKLRGERVS